MIDIVLLCPSSHTQSQSFSIINPSFLLQYPHNAVVRCLMSLLVCAVLYAITFTPSFVSSPECAYLSLSTFISSLECAHLSLSTCKLLFMCLHLIFSCPSTYCIPHAIIECRMTILMSFFPCLAARFKPCEDCSNRPLAPLFAYLKIF